MNGRRLRFAYNTNGFAHHRLTDVIEILAALGYDGVALTLDWPHLDPFTASTEDLGRLRDRLAAAGLAVVIETGGRYLLDPWQKHEPTLVSRHGRARRLEFLRRAVEIARALDAEAVSFFSGSVAAGLERADAWAWLLEGCDALSQWAARHGVALALEPEPGMLVDTLAAAAHVCQTVASPALGVALDVGHVRCTESLAEPEAIRVYAPWVRTAHIEDIAGREHLHRMFGEGDLVFEPILAAFYQVGFRGLLSVELSRDSHRAPVVAKQALAFLRASLVRSAPPAS